MDVNILYTILDSYKSIQVKLDSLSNKLRTVKAEVIKLKSNNNLILENNGNIGGEICDFFMEMQDEVK